MPFETTTDMQTTNATTNISIDICTTQLEPQIYQITTMAITITILVMCNTFLLIAIATSWQVLRQNVVNRYLTSCLVSTIVFCLLSLYETIHSLFHWDNIYIEGGILQRYNSSNESHHSLMQRDAYLKVSIPTLLLVSQLNIAALIYAVSDSAQFVGRYIEPPPVRSPKRKTYKTTKWFLRLHQLKWKKFKSDFLIILAWIIPMILSSPVPFVWNCIEYCKCLPMYRDMPVCIPPPEYGIVCMRRWPPLTRSYVITFTTIYFIAMIAMFGMLISTICKFCKIYSPREQISTSTRFCEKKHPKFGCLRKGNSRGRFKSAVSLVDEQSRANVSASEVSRNNSNNYFNTCSDNRDVSNDETQNNDQESSLQFIKKPRTVSTKRISITSTLYGGRQRRPLDDTVKLLIVMTSSLFLSVTPMMLLCFFDVVIDPGPTTSHFSFTMAMTFLYVGCLPFMLLRYMGGLRKACIKILVKCPCLYTIETVKPRTFMPSRASRKLSSKKKIRANTLKDAEINRQCSETEQIAPNLVENNSSIENKSHHAPISQNERQNSIYEDFAEKTANDILKVITSIKNNQN